jgi:hypothetical protein
VNATTRLARVTELLHEEMAGYPAVSETVAFDRLICPGGRYQQTRDGQELREPDGIHLERYAGEVFARTQLPEIVRWLRDPAYTP